MYYSVVLLIYILDLLSLSSFNSEFSLYEIVQCIEQLGFWSFALYKCNVDAALQIIFPSNFVCMWKG